MIVGLGLDLCETTRIKRAIEKPRFLERIYTPAEREQIERKGYLTAAGLFAAKEAVSKALGTGFRGFMPWDIEVVPDALGRPECHLMNGAAARLSEIGGKTILLSITHQDGMAAAVCVIER